MTMSPRSEKSVIQKILMHSIQQTYPLALSDVAKEHLELIIGVLYTNNISPDEGISFPPDESRSVESTRKLPWDLRRHSFIRIVPNAIIQPAVLCQAHNGLNPYVINHTFALLKREVTVHLKVFDRYTGEIEPELENLLNELRAIRGLWSSDVKYEEILWRMNVSHQHNKCEACMLAQVIETPRWLQGLRTTILSRTRTRAKPGKPHRAPQLLRLVDGGIEAHEDFVTELYYRSGQMAHVMKATRKLAVREHRHTHEGKGHEDDGSYDDPDDNYRKQETIVVYWDQCAERDEPLSSRTAVETPSSKTAVEDDEYFEAMNKKRKSRKMTPSELLLEEIIAEYAGMTGTENMEDARLSVLSMRPDLAPPTPLTITKVKSVSKRPSIVSFMSPHGATEHCRSSLAEKKSHFSAPRDNVNWSKIIHQPSPLATLSARAEVASRILNDNAEHMAFEYRDLLSPQTAFEYSDSEYSTSPIGSSPCRDTTWDLITEKMDIKYPVPQFNEVKKGKGLLRRFQR